MLVLTVPKPRQISLARAPMRAETSGMRTSQIPGLIALLAIATFAPPTRGADLPHPGDMPADVVDDIQALPTTANALWLLGGTAMTFGGSLLDAQARDTLARAGGPWPTLARVGNLWGDGRVQVPLSLSLWALGNSRNDARLAGDGYALARAQLLTATTVGLLKVAVRRERPDGDAYAFPSGHTAVAFATAAVLTRRRGDGLAALSLVLAGVTSMGRIEVSRHWLSDVLAGATIGWIVGRTVAREGAVAGGAGNREAMPLPLLVLKGRF